MLRLHYSLYLNTKHTNLTFKKVFNTKKVHFNASNFSKAQAALNKAQTDAANARDLALAKAQDTLTNSLNAAQDAYDKSIKAISESTDKQLTDLMAKLDAAAAKIRSLREVEPYKGKGIRFVGQVVRRKAGKTSAK